MEKSFTEADSNRNSDHKEDLNGCAHYRRKARLVAACCDKVFPCRLCHNDSEDHEMDRRAVREMVCTRCQRRQPMAQSCAECGLQLGRYFCAVCHMHDDEEKKQYHCESCGICRTGGRENYFHCDVCDLCMPIDLKNNHKCVQGAGRSDCGICLEDIHSARCGASVLACGHLLHFTCFREMVKHGISTCPKCKASVCDRKREWARRDAMISRAWVPFKFRGSFVAVLCHDCHQRSEAPFHQVGLKCGACGSYNTAADGPVVWRGIGMASIRMNLNRIFLRA